MAGQVDYDAIAQQSGGSPAAVDYDALARQHGATSGPSRTWMDSTADYAKELWGQVNPVAAVKGVAGALEHPVDTAMQMGANQDALRVKAEDAFKKGNYAEGVQHVLGYLTPIIGPQMDRAADLVNNGEYAKGLGAATGIVANVAAPVAVGAAMKAGATVPGAARLGAAAQDTAEGWYQSALKPPPGSTTTAQVGNMVKTGLESKIPVSASGVERLSGLVDDLNNKIKNTIQTGSRQGVTVDPAAIATRTDATAQKFANHVNPESDLAAIEASKQEFIRNNMAPPPASGIGPQNTQPIPAADAQALKQGTYQQLKGKAYGEMKTATVEAQKALARGIKEELNTAFPELSGLNADESKLLNLEPYLERAVRRIDNHQLFGIGTPIAAGGVGAATGSAKMAAAAGAIRAVLDNPTVKSNLAIALNTAGKNVEGGISMAIAKSRIQGYINSLDQSLQPQTAQ